MHIAMALLFAPGLLGSLFGGGPGDSIAGLKPGATVTLPGGTSGPLAIVNQQFDPPVTIDARQALVRGLRVWNSSGIIWKGGTIVAEQGLGGASFAGYAVDIRKSNRIRFDDVTFTGAARGMVAADSRALTVRRGKFIKLRSDGVDLAGVSDVLIEESVFRDFSPIKPTGSKAEGNYKDGDHPDAIQVWTTKDTPNPTDMIFRNNIVEGDTQGINTFGPKGQGYDRISVTGNRLRINYPAAITLVACRDCTITDNDVGQIAGAKFKANVRSVESSVRFCGNRLLDLPRSDGNASCGRPGSPPRDADRR